MNHSPGTDLWTESVASHKTDRANRIALAALEIVSAAGLSGLTMSAIASRAGISRQTLYRYFPDAESVLAAAVGLAAGVADHIEDRLTSGTPRERLDQFVRMTIEGAAAGHPSPLIYLHSLPPDARDQAQRHVAQVERLVIAVIADGVADGSFTPDLEPEMDGSLLYRLVISAHDLATAADDTQTVIDHIGKLTERIVGSG